MNPLWPCLGSVGRGSSVAFPVLIRSHSGIFPEEFGKVGKIIEENYFANELEPKWNVIKSEIEIQRNSGDDFALVHQDDMLEFFIVQYLRLEGVIEEYIKPTLGIFRDEK